MEVLVGFGPAAPPAYVRGTGVVEAQDNGRGVTGAPLSRRMIFQNNNGFAEEGEEDDDDLAESDRSSSSIGIPDDSEEDGDDDGEEVSPKEGFGSLASLEDSLPIKRGLSNHFAGKSKSFTNLAEVIATTTTSARDLEKTEHPFNKKRRILRWSKNRMMLPTAMSMPLLPVSEEDETRRDRDDDKDGNRGSEHEKELPTPRSVFKSYSCFGLADLREEDEDDEEDD